MDKLLKASMDNIEKTTKASEIDQQIYLLKFD